MYTTDRKGFTLVELMITIILASIIVMMAVPAFHLLTERWEARRVHRAVFATLRFAKTNSFAMRQNVLVCFTDTKGKCDRDGNHRLISFYDKNDNNTYDKTQDILLDSYHLKLKYGSVGLRAGRRHYIRFWSNSGMPRGHFGHIRYCPNNQKPHNMYQISFSQSGHLRFKPRRAHPTGC